MLPTYSPAMPAEALEMERRISDRRLAEVTTHRRIYRGMWAVWERHLLDHGGRLVKHPEGPEGDLEPLLAYAEFHHVDLLRGEALYYAGTPHECHANAAALWQQQRTPDHLHRVTKIGTGYALSTDGLWRQHSWAVTSSGTIVETTEPCVVYAGRTLAGQTAWSFALLNTRYT